MRLLPAWFKSKGFWNLPNTITVMRCLLVPVMVLVLWNEPDRVGGIVACAIFVGAMLSDVLDGYLARKWGLQSIVGAFLDPLADKLMVVTTLVMLIPHGWVPAWAVVVLEARELVISGLRTIAISEGMVIAAGSLGKFKTAYQSTALGFILFHYTTFGINAWSIGLILLYVSIFFSLASAAEYVIGFWLHARKASAARAEG